MKKVSSNEPQEKDLLGWKVVYNGPRYVWRGLVNGVEYRFNRGTPVIIKDAVAVEKFKKIHGFEVKRLKLVKKKPSQE